jgi:hypothetical protein
MLGITANRYWCWNIYDCVYDYICYIFCSILYDNFQKLLKTPAEIFGEARSRSYIYRVNEVQKAQSLIKIK